MASSPTHEGDVPGASAPERARTRWLPRAARPEASSPATAAAAPEAQGTGRPESPTSAEAQAGRCTHTATRTEAGRGTHAAAHAEAQAGGGAHAAAQAEAEAGGGTHTSAGPSEKPLVARGWGYRVTMANTRSPDPVVLSVLDSPLKSLGNIVLILREDPRWADRVQWSEFDDCILVDGCPLKDTVVTSILLWLDAIYGLRGSEADLLRALRFVAEEHPIHPVQVWLKGLTWDQTPRIDAFLPRYLHADDTPLHRRFGANVLISAVARALSPGCKVDTLLVLVGEQGGGKSAACAALVPDPAWYSDTGFDLKSKDAFVNLAGKWIYEIAEMESLRNVSDQVAKRFLSSQTDRYRAPYGRRAEDHRRKGIFIASTNLDEFLADPSGARRYWPVRVGKPDLEAITSDRDQLFAEAVMRYQGGEPWDLRGEYRAMLIEAQRQFEVTDPWQVALEPWLRRQTDPVTLEEAMRDALGLPVTGWSDKSRKRVAAILRRLGYVQSRPRTSQKRRTRRWEPGVGP